MDYTQTDGFRAGNRFFLSYSGSAPTAANCVTLAGDIRTAWVADIAVLMTSAWVLTEIDVLDIATRTGSSGQSTGTDAGGRSGTNLPAQCASGIEFGIARRYRGGKPRWYLPPGVEGDQLDAGHYTTDFASGLGAGTGDFFTAISALTVGSMGTLTHVNLSYYEGFTNITNSSGRTRAVPKYRTAALSDPVESYAGKQVISSQRRRRIATAY